MKLIRVITLAVIMAVPNAHADSLSDTFQDMINSAQATDPGVYKSKTRTSVSFGNFSVRARSSSVALFNFTPPSISAGCHGVSAHFGGFSFISGEQIQTFIQNVAQNAPGVVIQMAIKVGCEPCDDAIKFMQKHAADAAKFGLDSCMAAKSAIEFLGGSSGTICNAMSSFAGTVGLSSDPVEARGRCDDEVESWSTYQDLLNKKEDGPDQDPPPVPPCDGATNKAWCLLKHAKIIPVDADGLAILEMNLSDEDKHRLAFGEILFNMMPLSIDEVNPLDKGISGESKIDLDEQQIANNMFELASCGTIEPAANTPMYELINSALAPRCQEIWDGNRVFDIYNCPDSDFQDCKKTQKKSYKDWVDLRGNLFKTGLSVQVAELLFSAYDKVLTRQAFSPSEKSLIAASPIPLYQLLNLAATYPEIAVEALAPQTMLIADLLTLEYFESRMRKLSSSNAIKSIKKEDIMTLKTAISKFNGRLMKGDASKLFGTQGSNIRAIKDSLVMTINTYQTMLVQDVSRNQLGGNLSATKVIQRTK